MTPVTDTDTSWVCALGRALHYAAVYQVRYVVYWVICPTHARGGWWMVAPL